VEAGTILPQFLIDFGQAFARGRAKSSISGDIQYKIDRGGPDDEQLLFHYLYRRGRPHIRGGVNPSTFDSLADFQGFHAAAIAYGAQNGGTIGPNAALLPSLLMRFAAGAIRFQPRDDINAPDCACNNCMGDHLWCIQFQGQNRELLLYGRCLACVIQNRRNCSFRESLPSLG
jgi:hypothetical protein